MSDDTRELLSAWRETGNMMLAGELPEPPWLRAHQGIHHHLIASTVDRFNDVTITELCPVADRPADRPTCESLSIF